MNESPITPTVGRIVLVRGPAVGTPDGRDLPGIVQRVWGQNCINVAVFTDDQLELIKSCMYDDTEEPVPVGSTWRWMEYQKQADAAKRTQEQAA